MKRNGKTHKIWRLLHILCSMFCILFDHHWTFKLPHETRTSRDVVSSKSHVWIWIWRSLCPTVLSSAAFTDLLCPLSSERVNSGKFTAYTVLNYSIVTVGVQLEKEKVCVRVCLCVCVCARPLTSSSSFREVLVAIVWASPAFLDCIMDWKQGEEGKKHFKKIIYNKQRE